jgi:hypothetical protein
VSRLYNVLQHMFEMSTIRLCMMPIILPMNVATAGIPVCFWYQHWLHLWPVLGDALLLVYHRETLLTSCNPIERNLMGLSHKIKWAKPLVHLFLSIFIQKSNYWSAEMQRYSHHVITYIFMLQEAHHLNAVIINFPENPCNMVLLSVPW